MAKITIPAQYSESIELELIEADPFESPEYLLRIDSKTYETDKDVYLDINQVDILIQNLIDIRRKWPVNKDSDNE